MTEQKIIKIALIVSFGMIMLLQLNNLFLFKYLADTPVCLEAIRLKDSEVNYDQTRYAKFTETNSDIIFKCKFR